MKQYLAPLEGITTYIYRNAYHSIFTPMDKYFTPFLVPKQKKGLSSREKNDVLPEHNKGIFLVPQLLTNRPEDFIRAANTLAEFGYEEINLNLGCPSGTVTAKGKGAGFLSHPTELDQFLDEIFSKLTLRISIKTRIGMEDPDEFETLLKLFNQYPLEELIIHPRVREDYYSNLPNYQVFQEALENSANPLCYNGDIFTGQDFKDLLRRFPGLASVMTGRGIIANPDLRRECMLACDPEFALETGETAKKHPAGADSLAAGPSNGPEIGETLKKRQYREFHDRIYRDYQEILSGNRNVLFKMKEIWSYMIQSFSNHGIYAKRIKKAETLQNYEAAVNALFREQGVISNGRLSF
ncbi:tRNA-dihydrouridine synthase family protein [Petralouisia muris]|uniref:tRNA-dihydrouridine synthase family protein n=1 Tax=Petralouisia muris TaxID=3032872 RepID=A0AC61RXF8_9FIRM|nr:tRNA-dihydrouridine synthase family protein [Petralouisia muris]TGY96700.1 tRNA-dihydrouridine synthase family protein [Petralouisia muris]